MKTRLNIGHLILLFALAALPFAATFALYYTDERHYTDGALMMLKDGAWLVPHAAAGAPRFQKPPLAYWSVAASYMAFGVNVIASRLPFLLASCGTLFLTYRLARKLTKSSETALLAAVVLATHFQFFLCSIRSIPDALLVFFSTLSAGGFLRLIVLEEFTAGTFAVAYGGAAGAVLSKGLLGLLIIAFAWGFFVLKNRDGRALKKIIHWPIFSAAVIFAASWFIYVFATQGKVAAEIFFGDQVTGNVHGHFWSPLVRAPQFALILFFDFLPWSATAIELLARRKNLKAGAIPRLANNFILAWTTVLILGFALGENVSPRYLLPAAPLIAILVADCAQRSESVHLIFSLHRILKIVLIALILTDAAIFYVDSEWPLPVIALALTCGLFLVGIIALGLGVFWHKSLSAAPALGLALLLSRPMFFVAAMPVLLPDRSQQIAAILERTQDDKPRSVLLVGRSQLAGRVRVLLGKNWTVTQANRLNPADLEHYTRILISENAVDEFPRRGWVVQTAATNFGIPTRGELWSALKSRRLPELLARHGQRICLATRR